ncbi:MAG: CRISPR-associated endonuclease Cas2 [Deltaproteobacteria bacterium]|nr:CRISPR-associated endonuclease Cas2 [Deltaproteobacteria bacterium]
MNMLVAYDIAEPRRLGKVAKVLKDYGTRVQKSIFEVNVEGKNFSEMKTRIEGEIEASEDAVKYFPLCEKCAGTIEIIGQGVLVDPDEEYTVL